MESESKVIRRENFCGCTATNSVKSAASVSVDGHSLTMTPWKQSTFILFILSWIDISEEGCHDYFTDVEDWNETFFLEVSYVNLPDKNDSIRCTLERNKEDHVNFTHLLDHCYYKGEKIPNNTMCHGGTIHNISYHHLMCWTASALNRQYIGCYPGDLCIGPSSATTTTPPPPTTPTPTTTVPERTSTAPPPTTPTPTTTVPERTSTAPPPTTPTTKTVNTFNGSSALPDHVKADKTYDIDKPTVSLLSISVMLNVVLLLLVIYLWMRQRRKELTVEINLNEPTSPQAGLTTEEPNCTTPLQNHESSYLIYENKNENEKAPVCNSTNTQPLLSGNDCAVNKILP